MKSTRCGKEHGNAGGGDTSSFRHIKQKVNIRQLSYMEKISGHLEIRMDL